VLKQIKFNEKYKTYFCTHPTAYAVVEKYARVNFLNYIKKAREDIKNIVIVGGYTGSEIQEYLHLYPNSQIFVFEPHPRHYQILEKNYQNYPNVFTYKKAVSNETGVQTFYDVSGEGQSSLKKYQGDVFGSSTKLIGSMQVETIKLDDVEELKGKDIDYLQVDVQGGELLVLQGARKCLRNVRALMLECHTEDYIKLADKEPYKGQCYLPDLINYFQEIGINIKCLYVGLDNVHGNGQGNSFWINSDLV